MRSIIRLSLLCSLSLWLVACTTQPPLPAGESTTDWQTHRATLLALDSWAFSGRIAIRSEEQSGSATIRWRQDADSYRVEFSGPAGFKQWVLESQGGQARLFSNGRWQTFDPSGNDLSRELGWQLPLELMSWWLRGLPAPDSETTAIRLEAGRLSRLEQSGWSLRYGSYQTTGDIDLPGRIEFSRGPVSGKLLLKRWQAAP